MKLQITTAPKRILTVFLLIINFITVAQNSTISGRVTYKNSLNSTIDSCVVTLYLNGVVIGIDTTDIDGLYSFNNLSPGSYSVQISCDKFSGGSASTDALLTMRHFCGMLPLLTDLFLAVSDVNGDGYPNAIDALLMSRKFVGAIPFFPAGDWRFNTDSTITLTNTSLVQNFKALCFGDVNGSFIPLNSHPSN